MFKQFVVFSLLAIGLLSCSDSGVVFQDSMEIPGAKWEKDAPISFDFSISDTMKRHDFYLNLRNTTAYEWSNLYLFVEIKFPNEKFNVDTVEFVLANKYGEWIGKKSGSIVDNDLLFIKGKRFPLKGDYSLSFSQAMRQDVLGEITDVGLRIKEAKKD